MIVKLKILGRDDIMGLSKISHSYHMFGILFQKVECPSKMSDRSKNTITQSVPITPSIKYYYYYYYSSTQPFTCIPI